MAGSTLILRPAGAVFGGRLLRDVEYIVEGGRIHEIRPHTGIPEPFIVSAAFVNAHSHLEYRGLQGRISHREFWPWIREITRLKPLQEPEQVRRDARLAAEENRRTGVAIIGEHSDRPVAAEALAAVGIGGWLFQELITLQESDRLSKLAAVRALAQEQAMTFSGRTAVTPHALYTVDRDTLAAIGASGERFSLHLAESPVESAWTKSGEGPIAAFYRSRDLPLAPTGESAYRTAKSLGLVREGAQLVHCCDLTREEVEELSDSGATAAHCPRSNRHLGCPAAPVREMLDAGVPVGLGMDSAASSGPIDMFAEMRAALEVSASRGRPLTPEEVWRMATVGGASSLWIEGWDLRVGYDGPLLILHIPEARSTEDLITLGSPEAVEWI